ncbi:MAG: hypothetical protein IJT65_07965, partial [Eubacterium sp.]|nr:hypothetical protein [Eubacterium sp.]
IDHLNTAMKGYGLFNQEEPYIQNTDKKVSVGDYYIVTYYKDGKEVEYERDNCSIYFYDTESNTLYHIYYVW